jgi:Protein of unknown function (DUF2924)
MGAQRLLGGFSEALPSPEPRLENAGSLNDVIAGLADLDLKGLRLQWRNHLGGTPPAQMPRWLFLRVLAYQIQVAALGDLDKATLRVIRQPKGGTLDSTQSGPFETRVPSTRAGASLRAGSLLVREWKGKLERVMVLEKGFAWNGKSYRSLSHVAKSMTGTSWNGHRFFGLQTAKSDRAMRAGGRSEVDIDVRPGVAFQKPAATEADSYRCFSPGNANGPAAGSAVAPRERLRRDTALAAS